MSKVKVWNDNKYPHVEEFKGTKITIPAGECIEMDWEEAVEFKGQFTPMVRNGADELDPRFFKMIRVERPTVLPIKDDLVCHADGKTAATKEDLEKMLAQYSDRRVVDKDAEKEAVKDDPRIAAMQAQIEELKSLIVGQNTKKPPGRPRKEAVG